MSDRTSYAIKSRIICVLGMHRSGTSLITGLLNLLGVYLGPPEHLIEPQADNPKGFWEHEEITKLNDEILAVLGGTWHEPPALQLGWEGAAQLSSLRKRARALIRQEFATSDIWGWKDPRTCITLPFWQRLLPPMQYVICLRNPIDVASSLERRDGFSLDKGVRLWLAHVSAALQHTAGKPRLFVFYEDVVENGQEELQCLAEFIGRSEYVECADVQRRAEEFIDDELQHHRTLIVDVVDEARLAFPAKAVYLALRACVEPRGRGPSQRGIADHTIEEALNILSGYSLIAQADFDRLRAQVTEKEEGLRALRSQLAEKESVVGSLTEQVTEKEQQVEMLRGQVAEKEQQVEMLRGQMEEKEQQVEMLRGQMEEKEQQVQALRGQLAEREQQAIELSHELVVRVETLRNHLFEARDTIRRHEAFIHLQHRQLMQSQAELHAIRESNYWRIGGPLRRMIDKLKRIVRIGRLIVRAPIRRLPGVVRRDGLPGAWKAARAYLRGTARTSEVHQEIGVVMFISGCPGDAKRYRCDHHVEELQMLGCACADALYGEVDLGEVLDRFHIFVLHRVPYGPDVDWFLKEAHRRGKVVIFDTDDLVFDPDASQMVAALRNMSETDRTLFVEGLRRYKQTMQRCDAVLVSTESLQREALAVHSRVYVVHNAASMDMCHLSEEALGREIVRKQKEQNDDVVIAYFSGTPTHDRDFLEAADAVLWALNEYRQVVFWAVGHLHLDERFDEYGDRVVRIPIRPWEKLPDLMARVDINLAPLEPHNRFTDAKSCIKYIEGALLQVPTVASRRTDFVRVIRHGENGFLADSHDEWREALRLLIENEVARRGIGQRAWRDVLTNHTTKARANILYQALSRMSRSLEHDKGPLNINWVLRAPIASRGGGYRTIFRLADSLAKRGHHVRVYVEPVAHLDGMTETEIVEFVQKNFGPLDVDIHIGHRNLLPADATIATNWPTAYTVAEHRESLWKFYFVQDYEPEFYEVNDPLYEEAKRTYGLPLQMICIGEHLKRILSNLTKRSPEVIDFGLDNDTFRMYMSPENRPRPYKVLFFARPKVKRRGFELGIAALQLLKELRPDVQVLTFGASEEEIGKLPFDATHLGIISPERLAGVLNEAHILLCFSLSNISWVPFEGMGCGAAVVEVDRPSVREMVGEGTCLLAEPRPAAVLEAIMELLDDDDLRVAIARRGVEFTKAKTWERSADQFEEILLRRCFVRIGSLIPKSME